MYKKTAQTDIVVDKRRTVNEDTKGNAGKCINPYSRLKVQEGEVRVDSRTMKFLKILRSHREMINLP
jgi:hypothetical protein